MGEEWFDAVNAGAERARQAVQRLRETLTPHVSADAAEMQARQSAQYLRELQQLAVMQTPDLAEIMRKAYGAHAPAPAVKPAGLVPGVARLLGTNEATARDWLIAKVSTFRGESEATTAARLAGEEGAV
jgi:hypothetical protein